MFIRRDFDEFVHRWYDPVAKKPVRIRDVVFVEDQTIVDIDKAKEISIPESSVDSMLVPLRTWFGFNDTRFIMTCVMSMWVFCHKMMMSQMLLCLRMLMVGNIIHSLHFKSRLEIDDHSIGFVVMTISMLFTGELWSVVEMSIVKMNIVERVELLGFRSLLREKGSIVEG